MLSKTPFRIAGAAMLGTVALLGTNAANAQEVTGINLDAMDKSNASTTYANETLAEKVDDAANSAYYVVHAASDNLDVVAMLGKAGAGGREDDVVYITYTLEGMIFTGDSIPDTAAVTAPATALAAASIDLVSGGEAGDTTAIFLADGGSDMDDEQAVTLNLVDLGLMPNSSGSVSVAITNATAVQRLTGVPGVVDPGVKNASYPGAVRTASAVKATLSANTLTAIVADQFRSFGMPNGVAPTAAARTESGLAGRVGSITVEVGTDYLGADDGVAVTDLDELIGDGGEVANMVVDDGSSVTIHGDFSFAKVVWFDDIIGDDEGVYCNDDTPAEARKMTTGADAGVDRAARDLVAQSIAWASGRTLCIGLYDPALPADEEKVVAVPEGDYTASTAYVKVGEGMAPSNLSHEPIGSIQRDGTTVQLPVLTTDSRYRQKIVIVNQSGADAKYYLSADAGMVDAMYREATVEAMSTVNIPVHMAITIPEDMVQRTAGRVVVEAQPSAISIATIQTRLEDGSTDTIVYDTGM